MSKENINFSTYHGIDGRYTGPHEVAPTLTSRTGTGGNNLPIVEERTFARNRVDRFVESNTASTVAARQYKDATDLVGQRVEADRAIPAGGNE